MALGAQLTKLRLKKGESLQQVADAVNVSKAHIWDLEKGYADNPSMGLVTRLADHFGVSLAALVEEDIKAKDADQNLARMFRQAKSLTHDDITLLDEMLQTLIRRRKEKRKATKS